MSNHCCSEHFFPCPSSFQLNCNRFMLLLHFSSDLIYIFFLVCSTGVFCSMHISFLFRLYVVLIGSTFVHKTLNVIWRTRGALGLTLWKGYELLVFKVSVRFLFSFFDLYLICLLLLLGGEEKNDMVYIYIGLYCFSESAFLIIVQRY